MLNRNEYRIATIKIAITHCVLFDHSYNAVSRFHSTRQQVAAWADHEYFLIDFAIKNQ